MGRVAGIASSGSGGFSQAKAEEFKAAIVMPGVITDKSFNQTCYEGAMKAKEKLGWEPKTSFEDMVAEMAREDLALSMRDAVCKVAGFKTFSHNE